MLARIRCWLFGHIDGPIVKTGSGHYQRCARCDRIKGRPDIDKALMDATVDSLLSSNEPGPIDFDEEMNRHYIPLPGGFEVQTLGRGSVFRILSRGKRSCCYIVADKGLHLPIERMARETYREVKRMREALKWYAEQAADCRKVTSKGSDARKELDRDGGQRARDALNGSKRELT